MKHLLLSLIIIYTCCIGYSLSIPKEGRFSMVLDENEQVSLVRGNSILLAKGTNLNYWNGQLSFASVTGLPLEVSPWTSLTKTVFPLSCGLIDKKLFTTFSEQHGPEAVFPKSSPLIWFHDNGEYKTGCHSVEPFNIFNNRFALKVGATSLISLHSDGELAYLSSVNSGYLYLSQGQISLQPKTEVYFNKDKSLRFFTPSLGQEVIFETKYGPLKFSQEKGKAISWSLFNDGHIQRGILGEELKLKNFAVNKGQGVNFTICDGAIVQGLYDSHIACDITNKRPYIDAVVIKQGHNITTKNNYKIRTHFISFNDLGYISQVKLAHKLNYPTRDGQVLALIAGDTVVLDRDQEVIDVLTRSR